MIEENMRLTNSGRYGVLTFYGVLILLLGLLQDSPGDILNGMGRIIREPDFLITDYFAIGGAGATFVNSGLLTLIAIFMLYKLKISVSGVTVSTIWLISGFSLFGKNIFNIWFVILGVMLYALYQRDKLSKYIYIALLGTALAPMVTQIMFGLTIPRYLSIPLGVIVGIGTGFILPPLTSYMMRVHQGFNLYNTGFTAGILATLIVSIFKSHGLVTQSRSIWTPGRDIFIVIYLVIMFLSMIVIGFISNNKSFKGYKTILSYSGRLVSDFVLVDGLTVSLINMGINGLIATTYILLIGGDFNGPVIGGIFTITGFGAFGKHPRNMLPIFAGVFLGSITKIWSITDPQIQLAALFGTTLAPLAGEFGWKVGILAGFIHSSVVLNVGYLHSGFNLYNNGFAGGLVAAVLVPVIEAFRKDDKR